MTITSKDITFTPGSHRYHLTDSKPKVYFPSVTTVCGLLDKPFLIQWAANMAAEAGVRRTIAHEGPMEEKHVEALIASAKAAHREVREEGGNVGTAVHTHVRQMLDYGWEPAEDDIVDGGIEAAMAISAFDEWHDLNIVQKGSIPLLVEQVAVHPEGKYVGTLDLLLQVADGNSPTGSRLELVDWKTSNQSASNPCALYPEYLFQIAAYRRLLMLTPEFDHLFGNHPFGGAQQVSLGKNGQLVVTPLSPDDLEKWANAFETLVSILGTYREAQSFIRARNKTEKQARIEADNEKELV